MSIHQELGVFFSAHLYVEPSNIITVCKLCWVAVTCQSWDSAWKENPVFLSSLVQKCGRKQLLFPASLNAKNSPFAVCALCRWWRSQRENMFSSVFVWRGRTRACGIEGTKNGGIPAHQRAAVGVEHTRKSICANLRRAAAVMQLTAGSHFFNHLITLNWQVHLS